MILFVPYWFSLLLYLWRPNQKTNSEDTVKESVPVEETVTNYKHLNRCVFFFFGACNCSYIYFQFYYTKVATDFFYVVLW